MLAPYGAGPDSCGDRSEARVGILGAGKRSLLSQTLAKPQAYALHHGRERRPMVEVVADRSGLYRVAWPDGEYSPPANLTRCRDAARAWAEHVVATADRKRGGARRLKSLANFLWSSSLVRSGENHGGNHG